MGKDSFKYVYWNALTEVISPDMKQTLLPYKLCWHVWIGAQGICCHRILLSVKLSTNFLNIQGASEKTIYFIFFLSSLILSHFQCSYGQAYFDPTKRNIEEEENIASFILLTTIIINL